MEFERDPDKNEQNIGKHGIDFVRAKEVFGGLYMQRRSDRRGERRWIAVGPRPAHHDGVHAPIRSHPNYLGTKSE